MKDYPRSSEQIEHLLQQGYNYTQAIDGVESTEEFFNKHANFKVETIMSDNQKGTRRKKKRSPQEITKETFVWRTADKEFSIEEMDLDLKLAALSHALKHANDNFAKHNDYQKKAQKYHDKTEYFMRLCEIIENSVLEDNGLEVPSTVQDIKAMRRMIDQGIITGNFRREAQKPYEEKEENLKEEEVVQEAVAQG